MTQTIKDIDCKKSIMKSLKKIQNKTEELINNFNITGNAKISNSEIDFIIEAANNGIGKEDIKKIIKNIRKAAKKLKIRRSELHGVYLALEQMVPKKEKSINA